MKIIYFSSSGQSIPVLDALVKNEDLDVVAVVTKPDVKIIRRGPERPGVIAGEGLASCVGKVVTNTIESYATEHNLHVLTPEHLKDNPQLVKDLKDLAPDFLLCAHYSYLIPTEILEIPKHGALNLHFSLLPAYRGPSPLEWAIAEGETVTGISLIQMSPHFDTGQLVFQEVRDINKDGTAGELYERFFQDA